MAIVTYDEDLTNEPYTWIVTHWPNGYTKQGVIDIFFNLNDALKFCVENKLQVIN